MLDIPTLTENVVISANKPKIDNENVGNKLNAEVSKIINIEDWSSLYYSSINNEIDMDYDSIDEGEECHSFLQIMNSKPIPVIIC